VTLLLSNWTSKANVDSTLLATWDENSA